jgi:hypothetical protein
VSDHTTHTETSSGWTLRTEVTNGLELRYFERELADHPGTFERYWLDAPTRTSFTDEPLTFKESKPTRPNYIIDDEDADDEVPVAHIAHQTDLASYLCGQPRVIGVPATGRHQVCEDCRAAWVLL